MFCLKQKYICKWFKAVSELVKYDENIMIYGCFIAIIAWILTELFHLWRQKCIYVLRDVEMEIKSRSVYFLIPTYSKNDYLQKRSLQTFK